MMIKTREEVTSRVFVLRQLLPAINKEFDDKKATILLNLGPKPSIFRPSLRKAWKQLESSKMSELSASYNANPVIHEFQELQANCPHDFIPWSATRMGSRVIEAFQSRYCQICHKREMYVNDGCI